MAGEQTGRGGEGGAEAAAGRGEQPRGQFTVEFGDVYGRTQTIATLRLTVRGRWSLGEMHARPEGGRDVGSVMSSMPDIPGLHMTVNLRESQIALFDPLENDPDRLERINKVANGAQAIRSSGGAFTFVPRSVQRLSEDEMKTLLIELTLKLEADSVRVVRGEFPTKEQIAKLPGRRLFDPWNNANNKPKYADEYDAWSREMDAVAR